MNRTVQGLVIDCSFIMSVLLPDETSERSQEILSSGRYAPLVPLLWIIEVGNVLLTAVKRKRLSSETRNLLMKNISELDLQIDRRDLSMERIVSLGAEYLLTAYDAVYLDLALRTGFPMATLDHDLKTAALKAGVAVL